MSDEARNALYAIAVRMHESIVAGKGATGWSDAEVGEILDRYAKAAEGEECSEAEVMWSNRSIKLQRERDDLAADVQRLREEADRRAQEERAAVEVAKLAGKLAVLTLGAYQRDNDGAMRAFGSNAAAHVANDLAGACLRFKHHYQERVLAPEPEKA